MAFLIYLMSNLG